MERLLRRLRRGGYLPADFPSVETLAVAADHQLFVSIASNPYHVLRHLYHEKEACGYNLRARPHNFALPAKDDNNFVSRSLYAELNVKGYTLELYNDYSYLALYKFFDFHSCLNVDI